MTMCQFNSLAHVVSTALGSGESAEEDRVDLGKAPNYETAILQINNALKFG